MYMFLTILTTTFDKKIYMPSLLGQLSLNVGGYGFTKVAELLSIS